MAKPDSIFSNLLTTIDSSVSSFTTGLETVQDKTFAEVLELIKDLDTKGSNIKNTIANLKKIGQIRARLQKIILDKAYQDKVQGLVKGYDKITSLQNDYFASLVEDFKPKPFVKALKDDAIKGALESLKSAGVSQSVMKGVEDILRTNITTGGTKFGMINQLKRYMLGADNVPGRLVKYATQIVSDSLSQYSAQYLSSVSQDLGFEWYQYVGSNIDTTREFCRNMTEKRYIHYSEIPDIVNKDWDGKIPGTDEFNFMVYRGGYNCRHQLRPVPETSVPEEAKSRVSMFGKKERKKAQLTEKKAHSPDEISSILEGNDLDEIFEMMNTSSTLDKKDLGIESDASNSVKAWTSGDHSNIRLLPDSNQQKQFFLKGVKQKTLHDKVYRGTKEDLESFNELKAFFMSNQGKQIDFGKNIGRYDMKLISTTYDPRKVTKFQNRYFSTNITYVISNKNKISGLNINKFSEFPEEGEVVIGNGYKYEVVSVKETRRGMEVELEQLDD